MRGEGRGGGVRFGEAQGTFRLRSPGKQRGKPGARAQLSPKTALPTSTECAVCCPLSSSNKFLSWVQKARCGEIKQFAQGHTEVGLNLEIRLPACSVAAAVGSLSCRITCKPTFLISESRMLPGPEAPGPSIGFRDACGCCSLGSGWPGCVVSPVAAMARTTVLSEQASPLGPEWPGELGLDPFFPKNTGCG